MAVRFQAEGMKMMKTVREIFVMTAATLIIAAAVFFFLIPSHAAVSSVSGLAIVLSNFVPLSVSAITMVLNVVLLIAGFLLCGHEFGFKTVYTSILLPVFIGLFELVFPENTSISGDALLDVACYIFTVSIGLSILFNMNASSGGLDIVAKILNRYLHMDLGRAMSMSAELRFRVRQEDGGSERPGDLSQRDGAGPFYLRAEHEAAGLHHLEGQGRGNPPLDRAHAKERGHDLSGEGGIRGYGSG